MGTDRPELTTSTPRTGTPLSPLDIPGQQPQSGSQDLLSTVGDFPLGTCSPRGLLPPLAPSPTKPVCQ